MKTNILITFLAASSIAAPNLRAQGNHIAGRDVMHRTGEPDAANIADNDVDMDQAVQKARKNMAKFLAALKTRAAGQSDFSVKRPFVQGDHVEHIWLRDVTYDGKVFHGTVDNVPTEIKGVRLDQQATAAPGEISDWMYLDGDRLVGGYTIRALYRTLTPAEKRKFREEAGFQLEAK